MKVLLLKLKILSDLPTRMRSFISAEELDLRELRWKEGESGLKKEVGGQKTEFLSVWEFFEQGQTF